MSTAVQMFPEVFEFCCFVIGYIGLVGRYRFTNTWPLVTNFHIVYITVCGVLVFCVSSEILSYLFEVKR